MPDACQIQGPDVFIRIIPGEDDPRISSRDELAVHEKACNQAADLEYRMDVVQEERSEDRAHEWILLGGEHPFQGVDSIGDLVWPDGDVLGCPDEAVMAPVAVARLVLFHQAVLLQGFHELLLPFEDPAEQFLRLCAAGE